MKKQLSTRLRRLRRRAEEIAAEIAMLEQLLAGMEAKAVNSAIKLRKNSIAKWSFQSRIIEALETSETPQKASDILEYLRISNPALKSSTFRSYIRRMCSSGVIIQANQRGYYELQPNVIRSIQISLEGSRRDGYDILE